MKVILVAGARPNFMKIAPIMRAIDKYNTHSTDRLIEPILVHTGQHYDYEMSKVFFEDLELPEPDVYLGVGSGSHAEQTGKIMIEFEKVLFREKPDLVVVVGDVNSTLAGALAAVKLRIPIAHVEAGLRSFDREMPEEINRLLTDAVSDYLFTPSPNANENLRKEGIAEEKIFLVGDVMIDSLFYNRAKAEASDILFRLSLSEESYALLTLHRPENVDKEENLTKIFSGLEEISQKIPLIFPVHPRTKRNMQSFASPKFFKNKHIRSIDPLGYLDFLKLEMNAKFVLTDSGGIQEETTVLNIPCLTLRNTTERPMTVTSGSNVLVGRDTKKILEEAYKILDGERKEVNCPALWDGKSAERIMSVLRSKF